MRLPCNNYMYMLFTNYVCIYFTLLQNKYHYRVKDTRENVTLFRTVTVFCKVDILTTIRAVCKCVLINMSFSSLAAAIPLQSSRKFSLRLDIASPLHLDGSLFAFILCFFLRNSRLMSPRLPRARHAHRANRSAAS